MRSPCDETTCVCRSSPPHPYTPWAANSKRMRPDGMSDFARQVEELRPQLLRFARAQLRNDAWAEDAVSDTVLAALERPQSFSGGSQLKTWLVGILKHKLIDQLRRHTRELASFMSREAVTPGRV